MDIGGYLLSGWVTTKFDSFRSSFTLVGITALMMIIKLANYFFYGSSSVNLVATFIAVLITSCVYCVCMFNHTRVVRPDLTFISLDMAVAIAAYVSQVAPKLATLGSPSVEIILLSSNVCLLGVIKSVHYFYQKK